MSQQSVETTPTQSETGGKRIRRRQTPASTGRRYSHRLQQSVGVYEEEFEDGDDVFEQGVAASGNSTTSGVVVVDEQQQHLREQRRRRGEQLEREERERMMIMMMNMAEADVIMLNADDDDVPTPPPSSSTATTGATPGSGNQSKDQEVSDNSSMYNKLISTMRGYEHF